ncbi:DUF4382 domain-containing protein [Pedobacter zeae]|uniref:DUF4382 domain-containing protein n=1 Tax=Pedobacter zeae TaxID=1737356 RepID=A0A7W6P781_9SPHI|nr:DUF4382 domain-containing protein [Pedobacter zeae]MBB4110494.1 hypothetical protein [Pedobacter zeae]GGH18202.1 hypothetical protein GCM10007422_42280 [Pedobacter zeae]
MKTKFIRSLLATLVLAGVLTFNGCKKSDSTQGTTKVQIKMTDAPGNFDKINLSVKEVVLISGDKPYVFTASAGIFDILDFRIGTSNPDILVASGEMPSGEITEIRLVLNETGNTIVVNGIQQELKTPSGQTSGWKVKLTANPSLVEGVNYTLLLDFDAAKSIVSTGNGKYLLKPVVRGITAATTGLVSGTVLPLASHPEVLVIAGTDTVGTVADPLTGKFTVGGLASGTYNVKFAPVAGYRDSTLTAVKVALGQNTALGTITLKQ